MATDPTEFVAVVMIMGVPIVAIWTSHQRKMAELKLRGGNLQGTVLDDVRLQLTALREEVAALRDTSTKFDVSFDAAVSRLEDRVDRLESSNAPTTAPYAAAAAPVEADRTVVVGRRG